MILKTVEDVRAHFSSRQAKVDDIERAREDVERDHAEAAEWKHLLAERDRAREGMIVRATGRKDADPASGQELLAARRAMYEQDMQRVESERVALVALMEETLERMKTASAGYKRPDKTNFNMATPRPEEKAARQRATANARATGNASKGDALFDPAAARQRMIERLHAAQKKSRRR